MSQTIFFNSRILSWSFSPLQEKMEKKSERWWWDGVLRRRLSTWFTHSKFYSYSLVFAGAYVTPTSFEAGRSKKNSFSSVVWRGELEVNRIYHTKVYIRRTKKVWLLRLVSNVGGEGTKVRGGRNRFGASRPRLLHVTIVVGSMTPWRPLHVLL